MDIRALMQQGRERLILGNIESASLEASLFLTHLTGYSRTKLIAHDDEVVSTKLKDDYFSLIEKRLQGIPCAYLLGYKDFWGLKLKVNSYTLIPRADTETLVEEALKLNPKKVLDLGTGTGAIILALKSEIKDLQAYACDVSYGALAIASENAKNLNLDVHFYQSSWFDNIPLQQFDVIVSNPPYIEEDDPHLYQNGLNFEPQTALVSGKDGLDDIRLIATKAKDYLKSGGYLLLEHGYNQGEKVREILSVNGFSEIKTVKDLGDNERVTLGVLYKI